MRIYNVHERGLGVSMDAAAGLIDGLSSPADRLWPGDRWPPMILDGPLSEGARGGHGPVRYTVREYRPGEKAAFEFENRGFGRGMAGGHYFDLRSENGDAVLRHVVEAECGLMPWLRWTLLIRPLHDALLEDALDNAVTAVGRPPETPARWSLYVRFLHRVLERRAKAG